MLVFDFLFRMAGENENENYEFFESCDDLFALLFARDRVAAKRGSGKTKTSSCRLSLAMLEAHPFMMLDADGRACGSLAHMEPSSDGISAE